MEIPGLANENIFQIVRQMILTILQKCTNNTLLNYLDNDHTNICSNSNNNILIDSNFNCGFFIQRDFLYSEYEINMELKHPMIHIPILGLNVYIIIKIKK